VKLPPKNAKLTVIAKVDQEEDEGGSRSPVEALLWEGSADCYVSDKRAYGKFGPAEHVDAEVEVVIPYRLVQDFAEDFDVGVRLTTSRGRWRIVAWEDRRDFGYVRALAAEININ